MAKRKHKSSKPSTRGAAIRATRQTEEIMLPVAQEPVLVRPPDVTGVMLENGDIPNSLMGVFEQNGQAPEKVFEQVAQNPESTAALKQLLDVIAAATLVDPVVVDKPRDQVGDGEIRLDDLVTEDKLCIVTWAMGGPDGAAAVRFLEGQATGLADAPPESSVSDVSELYAGAE